MLLISFEISADMDFIVHYYKIDFMSLRIKIICETIKIEINSPCHN